MIRSKKKRVVRIMSTKIPGITLNEVLVVLVIVGILVLLALPRLMPLISKAKATEAKLQLNHLYTLEKSHFYMYSNYSDDFGQLGFDQEQLVTDGGNANYLIEVVEYDVSGFTATATAVVDFDGDGVYNVWEINQDKKLRETNKD